MKKVLITGASGFIGTHLVNTFLDSGHMVIGFSKSYDLQQKVLPDLSENSNYLALVGDVCDRSMLISALENHKPSIVIHLAAQAFVQDGVENPSYTFDVNTMGTWNLLDACRSYNAAERIIVASSDKAYGDHGSSPYVESDELKAIFPYDLSKKMAEETALSYYRSYGLPIVITRCGNAFGPYDMNESRIVPGVVKAFLNEQQFVVRSNGRSKRCYVFAADIADAYIKLVNAESEMVLGEAFNFGDENSLSVLELIEMIGKKLNVDTHMLTRIQNTSTHEIPHQSLNSDKAKTRLNWLPKHDIDAGLEKTISWYRGHLQISC